MQWLAEWSFVIFEFGIFIAAPVLVLASVVGDLMLARRTVWRPALRVAAAINLAILLVWAAALGPNLVGLQPAYVGSSGFDSAVLGLMVALAIAPLANAVFFLAYAVARRNRRRMVALAVPPAIPSTGV